LRDIGALMDKRFRTDERIAMLITARIESSPTRRPGRADDSSGDDFAEELPGQWK